MLFLQIIIFSLPLYLVRFSVFEFKTNILDVLLILFIIWQIANYKSKIGLLLRSASWRTDRNDSKYVLPIILILIGAIIATVNSSDISRSLGILKSYFILPILFFFTASFLIKTREQKEKVLKAFFLSGAVVSLVSIFYWLAGDLTYDGRLRAFFESPNQLAMFLAPAVIIGNYLIILNRKPYQNLPVILSESASRRSGEESQRSFVRLLSASWRIRMTKIQLGMAAVIGITIFLTKSLGAIASITISLSLFFIFYSHFYSLHLSTHRRTKMGSNFLSTAIIILLLVVGCLLLVAKKDFSERSSMASRIIIWQSAGEILKDNWTLGIGPGTFQEKYLEYQKYFPPYLEWASPQPHSIFLAFWLQTGIVGLAGFLWLIFIFFKNIWQNKNDAVIFLSGILMIYTLAHGMIDATYWKNDLAVMFWMIILLSLSSKPIESSTQQG